MALSDLRIFNWYQKYKVKAVDLTNLQTWLRGMFEGTFEGAFGGSVLKGCLPSLSSGLTVNISDGICVTPSGRIIVVAATTATFASPSGNPARSLVVARPKLTNLTLIPQPTNPSNQVYLYQVLEYDIIVLNGAAAPVPSYPAVQSEDVVLCSVLLASGQTTLAQTDFDFGRVDRIRKQVKKVYKITQGMTMSGVEDIIEADFSAASGVVVPPSPSTVPGQTFTVVKTDSSSNVVAVSGFNISGQNPVELDTQWQSVSFYSNGAEYRSY